MNRRLALRIGLLVGVITSGCGGSGNEPTPSPSPSPPAQRLARLWLLAVADDPDAAAPPRAALLRSDDLGATWLSLADSGLAETTTAIDFRDAEHGVAVGRTIAQRTNDGGRTWLTQIDDPRRGDQNYVSLVGVQLDPTGTASVLANVIDENFLNATGYESYLLPPDGSTPARTVVRTDPLARIESMCVTASGYGFAVGGFRFSIANLAYSTTLGTVDGGATWGLFDTISRGAVTWYRAVCAGEQDFWRFGWFALGGPFDPPSAGSQTIEHSIDGGITWDGPVDRAGIGDSILDAASFVDRETGWFCSGDEGGPLVLHTADAGATFVRQPLPLDAAAGLSSISFANDRVGAAAGSRRDEGGRSIPLVVVTTDGGGTWTLASRPPGTSSVIAIDAVP